MIQFNLQLFGGRGATSGSGSKGKASVSGGSAASGAGRKPSGGGSAEKLPTVQKKTATQIKNMTRKQAIAAAKPIFIRNNMRAGLSKAEATRRFNALVDGNTTAQLKGYIKRNQ